MSRWRRRIYAPGSLSVLGACMPLSPPVENISKVILEALHHTCTLAVNSPCRGVLEGSGQEHLRRLYWRRRRNAHVALFITFSLYPNILQLLLHIFPISFIGNVSFLLHNSFQRYIFFPHFCFLLFSLLYSFQPSLLINSLLRPLVL